MKPYDGYLIDLDGTMYRGEEKIAAAGDFIKRLRRQGIPYIFVTNNSSATREQVVDKLQKYDIPASPEEVLTSGMAAANVIMDKGHENGVYVIGEEGLYEAMREKGISIEDEKPDAVVIGMDRDIGYEKLAKGCLALQNGAEFISTNPDAAIPTERGLLPGNGSLTAVLTTATGREPKFIGKPEPIMMEQALARLGTDKERTLMVGDNYDTDILAGIRAGLDTLLVHTGVTSQEALKQYKTQPTYTVNSLEECEVK